ncbi:enoyl-ACP reductase FabI [Acidaminobacter sp.]|uniref:enoyl-ACP reductase FabI n=1 Tax=Acidaminobacter sp. TaxID=1872102 RepID=UPI00137C4122|nr:enoyl-ACP reductase [Acidaminobacter sp.]MDK9709819.1 enoyl-ACP reductase [Acidaminobacter sp.]MZQ96604.1 SDR family oxidoreductase [Acidaminobacter sp.]
MSLLNQKKILVMGVANKWSIAWGISRKLIESGAQLIFTYYGEKSLRGLEKLVEEEGITGVRMIECDVTQDTSIEQAFGEIAEKEGKIFGVVHSIAHADKNELDGDYYNTSRSGYSMAQDISAFSLVAVTKHALPILEEGGSIVTLSYLGGERVVKNYNVMGVAKAALEMSVRYLAHDLGPLGFRINAISAGPVKTLAAKGISGFSNLSANFVDRAPMRRMVTTEEIGGAAVFLLSSLGSGVTGEVLHVDCGYSILGY